MMTVRLLLVVPFVAACTRQSAARTEPNAPARSPIALDASAVHVDAALDAPSVAQDPAAIALAASANGASALDDFEDERDAGSWDAGRCARTTRVSVSFDEAVERTTNGGGVHSARIHAPAIRLDDELCRGGDPFRFSVDPDASEARFTCSDGAGNARGVIFVRRAELCVATRYEGEWQARGSQRPDAAGRRAVRCTALPRCAQIHFAPAQAQRAAPQS